MSQSLSPEARFHRIFHEHQAAMREYMSRRLSPADANDATAEVFLVAWRKLDDVPDGDEQLLWLYGVARNVARNTSRSVRRRSRLAAKVSSVRSENASPGPEEQLVRRAEDAGVLAALATLGESDRELLRLRTWEELSSAAIAQVLGISPSAVDMRLTRAKRRMAAALRRAGYSRTGPTYPRAVEERGS